jgi:hypothetical protein
MPDSSVDGRDPVRDFLRWRLATLWACGIVLAGIAGATIGYAISVWLSPRQSVAVGDVLTLGTLVVAVAAGLIALVAFAVSTGQPILEFKIQIGSMPATNDPTFVATKGNIKNTDIKKPALVVEKCTADPERTTAYIWIRNRSRYSARNPMITIAPDDLGGFKLDSDLFVRENPAGQWDPIEGWGPNEAHHSAGDFRLIQWDGGVLTNTIHGWSTRHLPELSFVGFYHYGGGDATLGVTLLADGYRRDLTVDMHLKTGCDGDDEAKEPQDGKATRRLPDPDGWR